MKSEIIRAGVEKALARFPVTRVAGGACLIKLGKCLVLADMLDRGTDVPVLWYSEAMMHLEEVNRWIDAE